MIWCPGILYLYFFVPSQARGQSDNDALRAENEELAKQACLARSRSIKHIKKLSEHLNLDHNDLTAAEALVHDIKTYSARISFVKPGNHLLGEHHEGVWQCHEGLTDAGFKPFKSP